MSELYPLKFDPVYKEKIWGGQKIKQFPGKDFSPLQNCGEAWILSGFRGNESVVNNGFLRGNNLNELVEVYMYDLVGEDNFNRYGNEFPILVKLVDSNDWLSIQVHPDDELARKRKLPRGKTEMWYILDADPGAELISGFRKKVNQTTFRRHLQENTLQEVLNFEEARKGDVFYIPAGRIHSLGPGILLAEIQETSDTTYRVFDWNRVDDKGQGRDLHIEEAMEALDFQVQENYKTKYSRKEEKTVNLIDAKHFTTNLVHVHTKGLKKDLSLLDSFVAYLCITGHTDIIYKGGKETVSAGEIILIPAMFEEVILHPLSESELLEVYVWNKPSELS